MTTPAHEIDLSMHLPVDRLRAPSGVLRAAMGIAAYSVSLVVLGVAWFALLYPVYHSFTMSIH